MSSVKKSEYIKHSRTIVRKLYSENCFGKGSMYEDNLLSGFPDKSIAKIVLRALCKQEICCSKKKKYGLKYYLNLDRIDKIK